MSAIRLLGVTMLRTGSNLRGIRSHPWRSRKKIRNIEMRPARVLGASSCPQLFIWAGSSLRQSRPRHWLTTETASAAKSPANSVGEVISGCACPSRRPMLRRNSHPRSRHLPISEQS